MDFEEFIVFEFLILNDQKMKILWKRKKLQEIRNKPKKLTFFKKSFFQFGGIFPFSRLAQKESENIPEIFRRNRTTQKKFRSSADFFSVANLCRKKLRLSPK